MEVRIGVQHATRELVIDSAETTDAILAAVTAAVTGDASVLTLTDERGRQVLVPSDKLAYVEIGEPESRRVGFGSLVAAQAERPSVAIRRGVVLGEPGEHPADLGQVGAPVREPADEQRCQRVPLGGHPLGLAERLAHQPAAPQRQPAGQPGVGLDRGPDPVDGELPSGRCPRGPEHQVAGRLVEVGRHLAVEVLGDAVADVRLDQALEPVAGRGALVEGLQRRR